MDEDLEKKTKDMIDEINYLYDKMVSDIVKEFGCYPLDHIRKDEDGNYLCKNEDLKDCDYRLKNIYCSLYNPHMLK